MNILSYVTPIAGAIVLVLGAIGVYLTTRAKNVETYATGWQGYAKKLEERITALETGQTERQKLHEEEIKEKNARITILEQRVDFLEGELAKYQGVQNKVDDAKAVLHETVEDKLNEIKN